MTSRIGFAVTELTTRSNLVGCSGISPALAPRKSCRPVRLPGATCPANSVHRRSDRRLRRIPARRISPGVAHQRERADTYPVYEHDRIGQDVQRLGATLERIESVFDVFDTPNFKGT